MAIFMYNILNISAAAGAVTGPLWQEGVPRVDGD